MINQVQKFFYYSSWDASRTKKSKYNPNSGHSFELQNRSEYKQNPPSAEERSIYQPLNPQKMSDDVTSSTYQSLTHSTKQCTAPASPVPPKENAYQNLPCRSKHHPLKKTRELCFEEVVIKKRQS